MAHVLQMIGEELDLIQYDNWNVLLPEGTFLTQAGGATLCCSHGGLSPAWSCVNDWKTPGHSVRVECPAGWQHAV